MDDRNITKKGKPDVDPEDYEKQTYNVNGTNAHNKGLFSFSGKYKNTVKRNDKDVHRFSLPITISVLIGTGIGIIAGLASGFGMGMMIICIFISLIVGLIINSIVNKKKN